MICMVVLFNLLFTSCQGFIPEGYVLEVTQNCGQLFPGSHSNATGAGVTIRSDLYVSANINCANNMIFEVPPIGDTNTETFANIYYPYETITGSGSDCFFYHPNENSSLYMVEIEVFWGFSNNTMAGNLENYVITCTTEGSDTKTTWNNNFLDRNPWPSEDLLGHADGPSLHSGSSTIRLIDVLDNEIKSSKIAISKKVRLELSVTDGSVSGVVPHTCDVINGDGSISYRILKAGCGDGHVFSKNAGFTISGTKAVSPLFRVFKLLNTVDVDGAVEYRCSYVVCSGPCDGSSCKTRNKRSPGIEMSPEKELNFLECQMEEYKEFLFISKAQGCLLFLVFINGLLVTLTILVLFLTMCCNTRTKIDSLYKLAVW